MSVSVNLEQTTVMHFALLRVVQVSLKRTVDAPSETISPNCQQSVLLLQ